MNKMGLSELDVLEFLKIIILLILGFIFIKALISLGHKEEVNINLGESVSYKDDCYCTKIDIDNFCLEKKCTRSIYHEIS